MAKKSNDEKKYSEGDLSKIRKRATEIWERKHASLATALDDWLEAERELKAKNALQHTSPSQYTPEETARIKTLAQTIRDEKVRSLRTAFDDWIEAERELKDELRKKIDVHDLFDMWFNRVSPRVDALLEGDNPIRRTVFDSALGQEYVDLMSECME